MLYDYNGSLLELYPTLSGDGVADDTAALQALVDTYKSVRLPSNLTIRLTGSVSIDPDKCKMFDGGNSTFIIDGDFSAFSIAGSLTSSMTANPGTLSAKIKESEAEFKIVNCKIRSSGGSSGTGVSLSGVFKAVVAGCYLHELKNGISIANQCRDILIAENSIYGCASYGIYVQSTTNLHQLNVVGNFISYCYYCIYLYQPVQIANFQCTGNDIEVSNYPSSGQSSFRAIRIISGDGKSGQLSEIEIVGNTVQGHSDSTNIIEIVGGNSRNVELVSIVGNHISNSTGNIIVLNKTKAIACSGNTFKDGGYAFSITDSSKIAIVGNAGTNITGISTQSGTNTDIVVEHNIT